MGRGCSMGMPELPPDDMWEQHRTSRVSLSLALTVGVNIESCCSCHTRVVVTLVLHRTKLCKHVETVKECRLN